MAGSRSFLTFRAVARPDGVGGHFGVDCALSTRRTKLVALLSKDAVFMHPSVYGGNNLTSQINDDKLSSIEQPGLVGSSLWGVGGNRVDGMDWF